MSFTSDEPQVTGLDETQLATYRGVSVAAIAALLFGICSALALAHTLLWSVPLVTIVVALFSLRAINAEGSNLTGRGFALFGLALALVFGVWAPSRLVSRQWHLYQQARGFGDDWLALLRSGKLYEAHQLTMREIERQQAGTSLESYYEKSTEAQKMFDQFRGDKPLKKLADLGDKVTYQYVGGAGIPPAEATGEAVVLGYVAHWEEQGTERSLPLRLALERQPVMNSTDYLWRIRALSDPSREP